MERLRKVHLGGFARTPPRTPPRTPLRTPPRTPRGNCVPFCNGQHGRNTCFLSLKETGNTCFGHVVHTQLPRGVRRGVRARSARRSVRKPSQMYIFLLYFWIPCWMAFGYQNGVTNITQILKIWFGGFKTRRNPEKIVQEMSQRSFFGAARRFQRKARSPPKASRKTRPSKKQRSR